MSKKTWQKTSSSKINFSPKHGTSIYFSSKELNQVNDEVSIDLNEIAETTQPQSALSDLIEHYPLEGLRFIPVVTEPQISYLVYNPETSKKNIEVKEEFSKLWKDLSNTDLSLKKIDFIEYKNNSYISSILHEEIPVLNELKNLSLILRQNLSIFCL